LKNSIIFLVTLLIISSSVFCQSENVDSPTTYHTVNTKKLIHILDKVFTDTAWSSSFPPDSVFVYYYNVRSKYPESSETLRVKASEYILNTGLNFTGSGYITFRFFIDSVGQMLKRVEVLQTDAFYKVYFFKDNLVWILYDFLNTLHAWKPARAPKGYPPFYINLMTFKIHEGNIVNIIP
jgi:hypothetical protein